MIPQANTDTAFRPGLTSHVHVQGETCPSCGQEIPPEKIQEIRGKIASRDRDQALALTAKLMQQHEIERVQADAKAKADLEFERRKSAAREATVREESNQAAQALINEKLAEAERSSEEQKAALQERLDAAEVTRKAAEQTGATIRAEMEELRLASAAALTSAKAEAEERETEIRDKAKEEAELAVAEKLAGIETAHKESEGALQARITEAELSARAAETKEAELCLKLDELKKTKDAELAKMQEEAAQNEAGIREEAAESASAPLRDRLVASEKIIAEANEKAADAEGKLLTLAQQQGAVLAENLHSQREVLEKAKDEAVNAERAKAFEENQKLSTKVNDLQRALEKKTNEELGEGAEIDLFEALKAEFPDDKINRIAKGAPGADILHVVMLCGKECGTIVYDSKNHNQWRSEHATKLRADQLAAKAEHAVLSTHKFPQGKHQFHLWDGVLLANPARVISIATLIRQHLLQTHRLHLSSIERESKTAALYEFIRSERYTQLLCRIDEGSDELLGQQAQEIKWHNKNWKKQGETIRTIQKAKVELEIEISGIIGTTTDDDVHAEAS